MQSAGRGGVPSVSRIVGLSATISLAPLVLLGVVLRLAYDHSAGIGDFTRYLVVGLVVVWLALAGAATAVTRRLRGQILRSKHLARLDQLTGLPNRFLFHERVAAACDRAAGGVPVAVAVLDLDGFKDVNDTFGHRYGDAVLIELAARLHAAARPGDVVARLGGDEFGVLLRGLRDHDDAAAILATMQRSLSEPCVLDGLEFSVGASIGYALAPFDGLAADVLLQRADIAMYAAKATDVFVVRYEAAPGEVLTELMPAPSVAAWLAGRRAIAAD